MLFYRLSDLRTASFHDVIYRDNFQPYHPGNTLLVYGTERFVAGCTSVGPNIKIFDFRHPKPYHHTDALACSANHPQPERPGHGGDSSPMNLRQEQCDVYSGEECHWHGLSRRDSWRPDATVFLRHPQWDAIASMTKASDMSDTFYCGVRGAVIESQLKLAKDVRQSDMKTNSSPSGWHVDARSGRMAIIETGTGHCEKSDWSDRCVPIFRPQQSVGEILRKREGVEASAAFRRLDSSFADPKQV